MKKLLLLLTALTMSILLVACGGSGTEQPNNDGGAIEQPLKVVSTFTLITDIIQQIGGEYVDVYNLVPIGTDPHEYEPLPQDVKAATDADILFYNGLHLEGGDSGWFSKLMKAVNQKEENIFELTEGVEPMYITGEATGTESEINPHGFLDPVVGMKMTENALKALVQVFPEHKEVFEKNAEAYLEELRAIDSEYKEKIDSIPAENRILVTSERAYQYMTNRYGLEEGFIWAVDTEENGSPEQIKRLVDFIKEHNVPALFVETNVDARPMETVSAETGVDIFAEIYSDEIGAHGDEGDTYVKFLKYNIAKIHDGLSQ